MLPRVTVNNSNPAALRITVHLNPQGPAPAAPASPSQSHPAAPPNTPSRFLRPIDTSVGRTPGMPPSPPKTPPPGSQSPILDARADLNHEALTRLQDRHGNWELWDKGTVPFFPAKERPPTENETLALRKFAGMINDDRNQHAPAHAGAPTDPRLLRPHDTLKSGEYGASFSPGQDGKPQMTDFVFEAHKDMSAVEIPQWDNTHKVMHSHPYKTRDDFRAGTRGDMEYLSNRMPSVEDHVGSAHDKKSIGADNYLIVGGRDVLHFGGRSTEVTRLNPSPLAGMLPDNPLDMRRTPPEHFPPAPPPSPAL